MKFEQKTWRNTS